MKRLILVPLLLFAFAGCDDHMAGPKVDDPLPGVQLSVTSTAAPTEVQLSVELREYLSCPFVFTWDGTAWQIENDLISVARGADREYLDYLMIGNTVVPRDGGYCFEIREMPSEQSWIDMVKLVTIDHAAGVAVGIDAQGNAHSYVNPAPPDGAAKAGEDVLSRVSSPDGLGVPLDDGESVVLDFASVDISAGAKLVLVADGFEGEPTSGPTGNIPAIEIQTLQEGAWVTRHAFRPKEYSAEAVFDLQPFLGESQSVRLLSVSCHVGKYHLIDFAGLDNTADALNAVLLDPVSAVLNGTTDVLAALTSSDDNYASMESDDAIYLCFDVSNPGDEQRSFAIVSEGYYEPTGNTFYVDTWDGATWVQRSVLTPGAVSTPSDVVKTADLLPYLPDAAGDYKVRIRNIMNWPYPALYADVDWVQLIVDGAARPIMSAMDGATDIRSLIVTSDDNRWNAMNQSAIVVFKVVIEVDIDIKPGSDPNSINCDNANEVITVAILTTDEFDALTVDHTTVTFEGASETHVDKKTGEPRRHEEDVDGDGDMDLVFHFRNGNTALTCSSTEGTLIGETYEGRDIEGVDAVRMVDSGGGG